MGHFEECKKQVEPKKYKKAENWCIAIGLQQVDGLTPSKYLIEVAKDNIEGKITIDEAVRQVTRYYQENPAKNIKEQNEKEADEVSARIAKLLSTHTFSFRPAELISIHKALFSGILNDDVAGKIRSYDIIKKERMAIQLLTDVRKIFWKRLSMIFLRKRISSIRGFQNARRWNDWQSSLPAFGKSIRLQKEIPEQLRCLSSNIFTQWGLKQTMTCLSRTLSISVTLWFAPIIKIWRKTSPTQWSI